MGQALTAGSLTSLEVPEFSGRRSVVLIPELR